MELDWSLGIINALEHFRGPFRELKFESQLADFLSSYLLRPYL